MQWNNEIGFVAESGKKNRPGGRDLLACAERKHTIFQGDLQ